MEAKEDKYPSEIDNLRQLEEFLPRSSPYLYDFSRFLADRINPRREITPFDFVMSATLAVEDLKRGTDGFTNQPIKSKLVRLPEPLYSLIITNIPTIAHAIYSSDFARQVDQIFADLARKRQTSQGQP